jgi:hypothetical protein
MFGFIISTLLCTFFCYDFFYKIKKVNTMDEGTDYSRVKKLYKSIKNINNSKKYNSILYTNKYTNNIYLTYKNVFTTFETIIIIKKDNIIQYLYSPKKHENGLLLSIPYYLNGKWYTILLPSNPKKSFAKILSIKTNEDTIDITDKFKSYLGYENDFHKQKLTPNMLGYEDLTISIFSNKGLKKIKYNKYDILLT